MVRSCAPSNIHEFHFQMDSPSFKYVPINELSNVMEEEEKINSGYYIDINKQLKLLTEAYDEGIFEQNPFTYVEHNTTEYLEYLKRQELENKWKLKEEPPLEIPIANVNLDNVIEDMSQDDINVIEDILTDTLNPVTYLDHLEISDSESVDGKTEYSKYNCLELGVAKTLIDFQRKKKLHMMNK